MRSLREELGPAQIPAPKGVVSDRLKSFDVEGSAVEAPKDSVEEEEEQERVLTRYQSIMERHRKLQEKKKNRPKINFETNDARQRLKGCTPYGRNSGRLRFLMPKQRLQKLLHRRKN
jgi:hypothetical protein